MIQSDLFIPPVGGHLIFEFGHVFTHHPQKGHDRRIAKTTLHRLVGLPNESVESNAWDVPNGPHRRLQCGGNLHPEGGSEPNEENQPAGWPLLNRLNRIPKKYREYTLPKTNSSHLKIDHWKRRFLLETIIFRGYVSFREYNKPAIRILISPIRIS